MRNETLLLYSRTYDLVEDHTSISPLSFICLPFDLDDESIDYPILVSTLIESFQEPITSFNILKEHLEVGKDISILLSKILSHRQAENHKFIPEETYLNANLLWLEEPMLRFSKEFPQTEKLRALCINEDILSSTKEVLDEEKDGGLQFPSYAWERRNEIIADIADDKMSVDKSVLSYLMSTIKQPSGIKDGLYHDIDGFNDIFESSFTGSITPPLSPLEPSKKPSIKYIVPLEDLTGRLYKLEINEDRLLNNVEFEYWQLESVQETPRSSKLLQSISLPPPPFTPSPVKDQYTRIDLHIEPPLTPPPTMPSKRGRIPDVCDDIKIPPNLSSPLKTCLHKEDPSPKFKRVRFSSYVDEFAIPGSQNSQSPGFDINEDENERVSGEFADIYTDSLTNSAMAEFSREILEPGARYFLMGLQQEQLNDDEDPDKSLRIQIPIMDWQRPVPPWVLTKGFRNWLLGNMDEHIRDKWDYRKSLDVSGLKWDIRGQMMTENALRRTLIPPEELSKQDKKFIEPKEYSPNEGIDMQNLPDFPLIGALNRGGPEDGDLEYADIPVKMDLESILKRKKRKTLNVSSRPISILSGSAGVDDHLKYFMRLQNLEFRSPPSSEMAEESIDLPTRTSIDDSPQTSTIENSYFEKLPVISIRKPSEPPQDPKFTFIVSASLFQNYKWYNPIRALCPSSVFVERDFSYPYNHASIEENETKLTEQLFEADILTSPLVGLVITSLQTIRQKPLSGKQNRRDGSIRSKVANLTQRYEKILVCVEVGFGAVEKNLEDSSGNWGTLRLEKTDLTAIASFTGFCEALGNSQVYVIHGTQDAGEIAWPIVELMRIYAENWKARGIDVQVRDLESRWERFLRLAGMNSYAAQAVLTTLSKSECTLGDFVTLDQKSRHEIFHKVLGEKVLDRVEDVLQFQWS